MEKIVCVTTELSEDVLNKLKKMTGENTAKEALYIAIEHYLSCQSTESYSRSRKTKTFSKVGRHPLYLKNLFGEIETD